MHSKLIVLVGGCFDFLHYGHIMFLTQAKTYGDHLVVFLESDEKVHLLKGEGRPFHTQEQRKTMLESLRVVNEVVMLPMMHSNEEYYSLIQKIAPTVIAFTEGDPKLEHKMKQTEMIGARAVVIPSINTPSTTKLAKLLSLE
jgi:rfaE bifunctional protein nucleotidyltransferase chain/domain